MCCCSRFLLHLSDYLFLKGVLLMEKLEQRNKAAKQQRKSTSPKES